jgi:D-citramalate synthase
LFLHLKVDRVEVASARGSDTEHQAVKLLNDWAEKKGFHENLEILGFIDNGGSVDWIKSAGGKVINLLVKGSEEHCRLQLKKSPQRHLDDCCREIDRALKANLKVNVYLEDWSGGMKNNYGYVYNFISKLQEMPIERIMLADTLGILTPEEVTMYLGWINSSFDRLRFDFHGHNDYGLVTANSIAAIRAGISGIHTTINGLGERAGNQPLAQLTAAVNDLTNRKIRVVEKELHHASMLIESLSGKRRPCNMPIVGTDVFTQTCGVHADGDRKGNLYYNRLLPERFGRSRYYALGKLSGKASIDKNLEDFSEFADVNPEIKDIVLKEVVRLANMKKTVTPADLPFLISGALHSAELLYIRVIDFESISRHGKLPKVKITLKVGDNTIDTCASGDGAYDAFVKALKKGLRKFKLNMAKLVDYEVRIPPGGHTNALVETTITWSLNDGKTLVTTGVDSDQLVSAIRATEKMLNLINKSN